MREEIIKQIDKRYVNIKYEGDFLDQHSTAQNPYGTPKTVQKAESFLSSVLLCDEKFTYSE